MKAVILFGHGSRDPLWRQPIEAIAQRMRAHNDVAVACAYLEFDQPDLVTAASGVIEQGAAEVVIVPVFLGTGKHAREDLPRLHAQLGEDFPGVAFTLKPAIGEDARVLDLIARIALE